MMTGLFGGSFDPVHFGHICMALELMEEYDLDEILFCPAYCSPFKEKTPPRASAEHRRNILALTLEGLPKFHILESEIQRERISYTIDTVKELNKRDLRLILSTESAKHLDRWRCSEELVQLAPPLVGRHTFQISSTMVRDRLKKNLYCGHLLPAKALDYIKENQVYCS